jgi:Carbohydrate-selective porin, OprB family
MYRFLFKLGKRSSVVLATTFLLTGHSAVQAQTTPDGSSSESKTADVRRTDAVYQTLQTLNAKYDCIPSNSAIFNTKKKVISRAEFAAGASSCIQSIEELVARRPRKAVKKRRVVAPAPEPVQQVVPPSIPEPAPVAPPAPVSPPAPPEPQEEAQVPVTQQDLDGVKALINAFGEDLQAMDSRIKKASFSTTTKLVGEGIINFGGYGGVPSNATRLDSNNFFTNRLRLNFDTSFMGKDRLRSRLQARDTTNLGGGTATSTNMLRLGFDGGGAGDGGDNNSFLSLFQYDFPLGDQTKIRIATTGYEFNDNQPTLNPQLSSSANGSISRFGRFNPIFRLSGDGAAVNLSHKLSDELSLDVGYAVPGSGPVAGNATATVTPNNGFFKGQNAILSQLTYAPSKEFSVAALYGRTYNNAGGLFGSTGSAAANNPFSTTAISSSIATATTNPSVSSPTGSAANNTLLSATGNQNTTADHYSFLATYKLSDDAVISGWAGFVQASQVTGGGTASMSNYAVTLAFPNFGAEGNVLGFVFGIPPKLNSRTFTVGTVTNTTTGNPDTSYHLEAVYKVKLNDNMDVTPGILLVTNPEHNSANPTEYVGTLRTTFRF